MVAKVASVPGIRCYINQQFLAFIGLKKDRTKGLIDGPMNQEDRRKNKPSDRPMANA